MYVPVVVFAAELLVELLLEELFVLAADGFFEP